MNLGGRGGGFLDFFLVSFETWTSSTWLASFSWTIQKTGVTAVAPKFSDMLTLSKSGDGRLRLQHRLLPTEENPSFTPLSIFFKSSFEVGKSWSCHWPSPHWDSIPKKSLLKIIKETWFLFVFGIRGLVHVQDPQTMVKINVKNLGYYNVDILPEDCPWGEKGCQNSLSWGSKPTDTPSETHGWQKL